jgi:hypothetical protein
MLQLLRKEQLIILNKFLRTWHANMSMSVRWQSKLLLFWKLFLKIQLNSKFDDTWFIVSAMKSTSTHIKESNWATIWIWTIKCRKEDSLLLPLQGLRIISRAQKQQLIQNLSLCVTYFQDDLALYPKTKYLLHIMNYNFYLRSNIKTGSLTKVVSW